MQVAPRAHFFTIAAKGRPTDRKLTSVLRCSDVQAVSASLAELLDQGPHLSRDVKGGPPLSRSVPVQTGHS
jgi:hypothetical protein